MRSFASLAQAASHAADGWWTSDHILALANVVLAAVGVTTIIFGLIAIRSSGKVAEAAGKQADASEKLAQATGKQAAASDRIAESALAENLAGVRPQLVEVPKKLLSSGRAFDDEGPGKIIWTQDDTITVLVVPVRNVGPGVAFVKFAAISSNKARIDQPQMTAHVIAPGDTASVVSIAIATDSAYLALAHQFARRAVAVSLGYTDVNGAQPTLTRLTVARAAHSALVARSELFHCDEKWDPIGEPFASTTFLGRLQ
jgi:hypothetical protein